MNPYEIQVTQPDFDRLDHLIDGWWAADGKTQRLLDGLRDALDRARVVDSAAINPGCVTLGSEVALRNLADGQRSVYRLMWPGEAARYDQGLSVLSPLGVAVIGRREGDVMEFEAPGGMRRLRVEKVRFQPEAALRATADCEAAPTALAS